MIHLLLGIPAASIRLSPFVTAVNHVPPLTGARCGLEHQPARRPSIACPASPATSARISPPGVLSSGMDDTDQLTLFMDVGTNGEIVLGSQRMAGDLRLFGRPGL